MLFDLKLSNGFWNQVNREARHINIVLAAGEIQVRFVSKKGANYQTKMVQGMALELPKFDRVEIKGETDQQIKVWVSDVPLSYSPDSSRQVGSNALRSSVGYVYSGYPHALLPAEIGRNKVTLTPQQDIYIGGTNLNTKNGVLLKAGQVFNLATQGAVYALETSGNFQPYFTALADPTKLRGEITTDNKPIFAMYFENKARTRGWGYKVNGNATGAQTDRLYEYDPATLEPTGFEIFIRSGTYKPSGDDFFYVGDDVLMCMTDRTLYYFDLNAGVMTSHVFDASTSRPNKWAQSGDKQYVMVQDGNIYESPLNAQEWTLYADAPPVTQGNLITIKGFSVTSAGRVVVANTDQLWFKDEGGVWTQGATWDYNYLQSSRAMDIDLATDTLYGAGRNGVYISNDGGVSWSLDCDMTEAANGRELKYLTVLNGAVLAVGVEGFTYRNPITGEYGKYNIPFGQRGGKIACLSESGRIYFGLDASYPTTNGGDGHYFLNMKGEASPVAGLPVSIMAEVN